MTIIMRCSIIITILRITFCINIDNIYCAEDKNSENYSVINVMNGINFRKKVENFNNNDTQLEFNGKTNENKKVISYVTLQSVVKKFFNSHVVEFNLSRLLQGKENETPRHRRRNQMSMILMGIVIFLMFFTTLGFQLLATFGGKAFLMAKMALLLASINGIKRVASSGVHYGLYHTPSDPTMYAYDRFDRPRKFISMRK